MNANETWAWFRTTLYSIGDGVITTDTAGAVLQMNPAAETLTGWSEAEALGRPIEEVFQIVNETTRREVENPIKQVILKGTVVGLANHTLLISRDGTERPIADSGAPIRNEAGEIKGAVLVFSDRSAERLAEQALLRERDRAQQYLDIVGTAIVALNADQTVSMVNKACCQLLGYDEADILGKNWFDCFLPERDRASVRHVFEQLIAGAARMPEFHDNTVLTRTGEERSVVWHNTPLCDDAGQTIGTLSAGMDITDRKRMEESLRESEQRFRDLAEGMSEAIWLTSPDYKSVFYVNKAYEKVWGSPRNRLYGDGLDWLNAIVDEDRPAVESRLFRESASEPSVLRLPDFRLMRSDGGIRAISAKSVALHDERGRVQRVAIVAADVTDSKQARGEKDAIVSMSRLFLSSDSLDRVFRTLPQVVSELLGFPVCAIAEHDPTTDEMQFRGTCGIDAAAQFSRVPAHLSLAGNVVNAATPVVEADCTARTESAFTTMKTFGLQAFLGVPIILRDRVWGSLIVADRRKRPQAKSLIGTLQVLANHLAQEISRYHAERTVTEREAELSAIYDHAPLLMLLLDGAGKIRKANRYAAEYAGVPAQLLIGRQAGDALLCAQAAERQDKCGSGTLCDDCKLRQTVADTIELGAAQRNVEVMLPPNGKLRPATFLVSTKRFNIGDEQSALVTMLDITDRKQAEEDRAQLEERFRQSQKMESVGRLAGGVAHDFNNALQVIQGHAEMAMAQLNAYDPLVDDLRQIRQAADRSADLTRQLLGFARRQAIRPRKVDLNDLVTETQRMLRRLVGENIEISWRPAPQLWSIRIDPSQVDQILANLVINARDAILDTGLISIETGNVVIDEALALVHPEAVPGHHVMLMVSDNGSGMSPETVTHLFEPFYTTKPAGKGTGLGLATVYGIVKQNGGFINVYSEVGRGTSFKIYLPRDSRRASVVAGEPPASRADLNGTETLLLVEDEYPILQLGKQILEQHGYQVLTAQTPAEALALASQHPGDIHMLITDVVMPGMNGKELREHLTTMRPGLKSLFISGYTADLIARSGVLDDGVHLLQKPFSVATLTEKVRDTLQEPQQQMPI